MKSEEAWEALYKALGRAQRQDEAVAMALHYRPMIEAASDAALSLERLDHEETREALNTERLACRVVQAEVARLWAALGYEYPNPVLMTLYAYGPLQFRP